MQKFLLVLGYIFTFGILYVVLKNKAKKTALVFNDELRVSTKIPFNVDKFINALGGKPNILQTSSTISSIKINVSDRSKVNEADIKALKPKGYMWDANQNLTLIFGDFVQALETAIKESNHESSSQ